MLKGWPKSGAPNHCIHRRFGTIAPNNPVASETFERSYRLENIALSGFDNGWHHDDIAQPTHWLLNDPSRQLSFPALGCTLEQYPPIHIVRQEHRFNRGDPLSLSDL
ncbi:hypothetical protein D3C86_1774100 [compost metagenome]